MEWKKPLSCNINKNEMNKCQIITHLSKSTITAGKVKFSSKENFISCAVNLFFCRPSKIQRNLREASFLFENYENDVTKDFTAVKIFDERFSRTFMSDIWSPDYGCRDHNGKKVKKVAQIIFFESHAVSSATRSHIIKQICSFI